MSSVLTKVIRDDGGIFSGILLINKTRIYNTIRRYVSCERMSVLGMPLGMFLVFAATLIAGSLGALHYVVVHVLMGKPVDESGLEETIEKRGAR